MKKFFVFLWAMVFVFGIGSAWALPVEIGVNPKSTYLHLSVFDVLSGANPNPTLIDLFSLGFAEGDVVRFEQIGDYSMGGTVPAPETPHKLGAVFSSSTILSDALLLHRVPGAIDVGIHDVDDVVDWNWWGEPQDIPEDFVFQDITIEIPVGGQFLFVGAIDAAYWDNFDAEEPYFAVRISPVPEPATMLLLGSGLIGLAAFRRRFRKS